MSHCEHCGRTLPEQSGRGRRRRYCGQACRKAASRDRTGNLLRDIPDEMMLADRWMRWRSIERDGRRTKLPIQVDGLPASSTDPDTWTTFPAAEESRTGDGLGFALGNGFACIDLDHCYDSRNHLKPWAKALLAYAPATFVEISPSGDGLHIWGHAAAMPGVRIRRDDVNIEIYSRDRYMTVTGRAHRASTRALADITGLIDFARRLG